MDFDKLLENCQTLERTISILVKNNAKKQAEVLHLQKCIVDNSQASLNELLEKERQQQETLDSAKQKKADLDIEIKQYSEINDKLSHLVSIVQRPDDDEDEEGNCKTDEIYFTISETLEDFEQVKIEYAKFVDKLDQMDMKSKQNASDISDIIDHNQVMMVEVHQNDSIFRLLEQQNKYSEQQFDLILNELPWEPLTDDYINELRKSKDQAIQELAETLELQKSDIQDLNESLGYKKKEKLDVLEDLLKELNLFVQKRDEAILVTRFIERD